MEGGAPLSGGPVDGGTGFLGRAGRVAKVLGPGVVAAATLLVLLDLFGVVDLLDGDQTPQSAKPSRLPGEYLYLDDERVDAYLGQLRRGLAPSQTRSTTSTARREAKLGASDVVQLGGSLEEHQKIEETVSLRAADRYYALETELKAAFHRDEREAGEPGFRKVPASRRGCGSIAKPKLVKEGEVVRITGAQLLAPTYVLALAKVAHAAHFRSTRQIREDDVSRQDLGRVASRHQAELSAYVKRFGPDPRLPLRLEIEPNNGDGRACTVFLPLSYSKLTEAPSLLTGKVTIVGKVVRRLTPEGQDRYFDVEAAVTYGKAVRTAAAPIRRALQLTRGVGRTAVAASASIRYPGLVVLPLAIYK